MLTDMVMPDRMTGRQLGKTLQAERPNLSISYTIGYNLEGLDTDFILREGHNYLRKPYQAAHLLQTIRQILGGAVENE